MEDAHAAVLPLDQGVENSNTFFAVYNGHGGAFPTWSLLDALNFSSRDTGDSVAKFASINIHKRLVAEDAYREKRYEEALKMAFLGTDQDFLASMSYTLFPVGFNTPEPPTAIDAAHTKSSLGSTAVAALFTGNEKIYVVCNILTNTTASLSIGLLPSSGKCGRL